MKEIESQLPLFLTISSVSSLLMNMSVLKTGEGNEVTKIQLCSLLAPLLVIYLPHPQVILPLFLVFTSFCLITSRSVMGERQGERTHCHGHLFDESRTSHFYCTKLGY